MIRVLLLLWIICAPLILKAQSVVNNTTTSGIAAKSRQEALKDISENKAKLVIWGGLIPKHYKGQEDFEKKYQLTYRVYGCVPPRDMNMSAYNTEVFKYLDKRYGKDWRKEVRPDVVGL